MRRFASVVSRLGLALAVSSSLASCGKLKQNDAGEDNRLRAEAKRHQSACGSSTAFEPIKGLLFDQAIQQHGGDQKALDTLADYSFVRMEDAVVTGSDAALDITRCRGHLVLEVPAGARPAFAGQQHLGADIEYSAQAAADGHGFVYKLTSPVPFIAQLAQFHLNGEAYRPPPAFDERVADASTPAPAAPAPEPAPAPPPARAEPLPPRATVAAPPPAKTPRAPQPAPQRDVARVAPHDEAPAREVASAPSGGAGGADTVRRFYNALGAGNGEAASAQVIPEKQNGRTYSPAAISRFYGKLPGPLQLTGIEPAGNGAYRATYRYSTGRSHCDGVAVVRLTTRNGRQLIRSISALRGC